MTDLNYNAIESLVAANETKGNTVNVTFRCPTTGVEATSSASIERATGVAADATRSAKKNMWSSLRRSVMGAIGDAFGSGAAGRVARDAASSSIKNAQSGTEHGKAETEAAIVKAFEAVQTSFRFDAEANAWRGLEAAEETQPMQAA